MRSLEATKFKELDDAIRAYVKGENGFDPHTKRYETVTGNKRDFTDGLQQTT